MSHSNRAPGTRGTTYAVTFAGVAVAAAQDLFEIVAPATSRLLIKSVRVGQYSDFGDAAAELLGISFLRGHTTSGSGGSAATPANLSGHTGARAAGATAEVNNTTIAADGSPVTLFAGSYPIDRGFCWEPPADRQVVIEAGQRFVVRLTAPADSLTSSGTLIFEEIGT